MPNPYLVITVFTGRWPYKINPTSIIATRLAGLGFRERSICETFLGSSMVVSKKARLQRRASSNITIRRYFIFLHAYRRILWMVFKSDSFLESFCHSWKNFLRSKSALSVFPAGLTLVDPFHQNQIDRPSRVNGWWPVYSRIMAIKKHSLPVWVLNPQNEIISAEIVAGMIVSDPPPEKPGSNYALSTEALASSFVRLHAWKQDGGKTHNMIQWHTLIELTGSMN